MTVASLQFPVPNGLRLETGNWKLATPSDSSFAHCVCEPPALAGAVASALTLGGDDGLCGRKKLPFAGYSVVKERVFEAADVAAGGGRLRDSFSPNCGLISLMRARLLRAPCHSPELLIVTSLAVDCKQNL